MQDILDHLTELAAAEPADVAAEKPRNHLAALVEAELPVARPGEVLKVGKGGPRRSSDHVGDEGAAVSRTGSGWEVPRPEEEIGDCIGEVG